MREPWTISVDLDGVLAMPTTPDNYAHAKPIWDTINKVNRLYDAGHRIIIYTARGWFNYDMTYAWLVKYNVKFSQLVCGKLYAHCYIDDLNKTIDEVMEKLL